MSSCEFLTKKHRDNDQSDAFLALKAKSCKSFSSDASGATVAKVMQHPSKQEIATSSTDSGSGEYYKRYDYDVVPVKESVTSETSTGSKEERLSLTESYLNKIERNISEELQTDCSTNTLDSSIKFFKVTVEEIFSKFYDNMQDFEAYKKKFHEILSKDQGDCVDEMEDFIKDMIRHIMSSESSNLTGDLQCKAAKKSDSSMSKLEDMQPVMEAFKNENYFSVGSESEEKGCVSKERNDKVNSAETLNIYLMSNNPYLKIRMNNNNNHLSEIQIMERRHQDLSKLIASADDMKLLSSKRMELAMIESLKNGADNADREIPVKISFAKKNIHCDEESYHESNRSDKSFLSCLCGYLCKKLRKATNLGL